MLQLSRKDNSKIANTISNIIFSGYTDFTQARASRGLRLENVVENSSLQAHSQKDIQEDLQLMQGIIPKDHLTSIE